MEKQFVEIPQVDVPDEFTQVDLPEIGETTPHPSPSSPQVVTTGDQSANKIGFTNE